MSDFCRVQFRHISCLGNRSVATWSYTFTVATYSYTLVTTVPSLWTDWLSVSSWNTEQEGVPWNKVQLWEYQQTHVELILVFKLSPCCSNDKLSAGYFAGVWVLKADVSEHCVGSVFNRWWSVSEDWLLFSPYLYGKRISWKVVWANQKWGRGRGRGSGSQVGV